MDGAALTGAASSASAFFAEPWADEDSRVDSGFVAAGARLVALIVIENSLFTRASLERKVLNWSSLARWIWSHWESV